MLAILLAQPGMRWVLDALAAHEKALLRYAATLVGPEGARDVVQETFLELCRADRATVEGHLVPWLFTVCKNRALSVRRREKKRANVEEEMGLSMGVAEREAGPHGALERKEASEAVSALLADLPERSREVVSLKFAGGLSYKEIAEVTGLTVSHVGVILHEALCKVRERMQKRDRAVSLVAGRQS